MKTLTTGRFRQLLYAIPPLILVLTGVLYFVYQWQREDARRAICNEWISETAAAVDSDIDRFFEPVVTNLRIAADWGEQGAWDPALVEETNARFMPILAAIPQISSMMIANSRGQEYLLRKTPDGFTTRHTDRDGQGNRTLWQTWSKAGARQSEEWKEIEYDPRGRPWFSGAIEAQAEQNPFWTEPYTFFTAREPGITASLCRKAEDGTTRVVGFDVLLLDISSFTIGLDLGDGGRACLVTGDARMVGLPRDPRYLDMTAVREDVLKPVLNLDLPDLPAAARQWISGVHGKTDTFPIQLESGPGWAGFRPIDLGSLRMWLSVVVPESVLRDRIGSGPHLVTGTIIAVGLIGFALSILLIRRHNRHLEELTRNTRRLIEAELTRETEAGPTPERILELIHRGESEQLEFKSTVRHNLKAGKPGKEIEIAWLKGLVGFLNTEGGVMLIGVNDTGTVIGIDPDKFANEDKALRHVDNLIGQHIGLEFSHYLNFTIVKVEGHQVVVIRCRRSDAPAFLKNGQNEDFYVRTGPASRKLQPSQILKYVETRKSEGS